MKYFFLILYFISAIYLGKAQSLTIQNGATVTVTGDGGTGTDGTLNVEGDLVIENGGKLAAENDARFFVSGDIHYEEGFPFNRGASIFTLNGAVAQEITNASTNGDFTFFSLVLDNAAGFTINTTGTADADIFGVLDVQSGQLTTNGKLIIEAASPTSYGRVAYSSVSNPIVGDVIVKKRLSNTDANWRQINMPVEGNWEDGNWTGITFNFSDHLPANQINAYSWKASGPGGIADGWQAAAGTTGGAIPLTLYNEGGNTAFEISTTISCEGELRDNVASFTYNLQFTRDPGDLSGANPNAVGWNNIPNPWAALVDVQALLTSTTTNEFDPQYKAVHVFNSVAGQYQPILLDNMVTKIDWNTDGTTINDADANIPPFQSFWVKADAINQVVTLFPDKVQTTEQKNTANEQFMKQKPDLFRLNVFDCDSAWDQIVIYFKPEATREFDDVGDAYFLKSPVEDNPSFYGIEGDVSASIIGRPSESTDSVEVAYGSIKTQSTFHIMPDLSELPAGWFVYLKDRLKGKTVKLNSRQSYAFTNHDNSMSKRFVVYYSKNESAFNHLLTGSEATAFAFVSKGNLSIQSNGLSGKGQVNVFDPAGRQLMAEQVDMTTGEPYMLNLNPINQLLVVEITIGGQSFVQKVFY